MKIKIVSARLTRFFNMEWHPSLRVRLGTSSCIKNIGGKDTDT